MIFQRFGMPVALLFPNGLKTATCIAGWDVSSHAVDASRTETAMQRTHRSIGLWILVLAAMSALPIQVIADIAHGDVIAEDVVNVSPEEQEAQALATAVALNYCRAAFHRIRMYPTLEVMSEEQQKILNNLNLDRVDDPEIIDLYTAVLDEINQIQLAGREHGMYQQYHTTNMRREVTWDALAFSTELATAQFGSAIRTGANSWWDYRGMEFKRDTDLLRIERERMNAIVRKSSEFMDTFWHLAQKRSIPDRWLVRGDDLDQLELAMQEEDAEVRLRILTRMEDFMEAYPPYWYYLARTQQELGVLSEAVDTYGRLEALGQGHFRRDDMLATGLANKAVILDSLLDPTAVATAERALQYSPDAWEANLICARILERNGLVADAEDAILRNLDVNLETAQSRVFLVSLYYHAGDTTKLARVLSDPAAVAELPAPVLLRCVAMLGPEETPDAVLTGVLGTLEGQPLAQFGQDEFILSAGPGWQLHLATMTLFYGDEPLPTPQMSMRNGQHLLRFASPVEWGPTLTTSDSEVQQFIVQLRYPDDTTIKLTLGTNEVATPSSEGGLQSVLPTGRPLTPPTLHIAEIQVGESTIAVAGLFDDLLPIITAELDPIVELSPLIDLRPEPLPMIGVSPEMQSEN